jgi:hypothetical protein
LLAMLDLLGLRGEEFVRILEISLTKARAQNHLPSEIA